MKNTKAVAKYASQCCVCGETILAGTPIVYGGGRPARHEACDGKSSRYSPTLDCVVPAATYDEFDGYDD